MIEFDYSKPFSEHLKDNRGKYAIIVSKSQYAILADDIKRTYNHENLSHDLIEKMRPDLILDDWGNVLNKNEKIQDNSVLIYGYPHYFQLHMTELFNLSPEQFECIRDMLLTLKEENRKVDEKGYGQKYEIRAYGSPAFKIEYKDDYGNDIDYLIEQLSKYVKEARVIPEETIIGIPIRPVKEYKSEEETKNILAEEMLKNLDFDKDFPVFEKDNNKKLGYSSIFILGTISILLGIVILVLGMIINTL